VQKQAAIRTYVRPWCENQETDSVPATERVRRQLVCEEQMSAPEPFQGWTLAEALERTAEPDLWKAWIAAKDAWEKARVPTPAGPSASLHRSPQELKIIRSAAEAAFRQVKDELWRYLIDGRLAATASRGSRSEFPTPIYSAGWQTLIAKNWEKSIVQERGSQNRMFNVRIFPVLHSPDAHARLVGRSLSDVCRRYVIEDPEVAALGKRVIREDELHAAVFREGQYPGIIVDFKWPLDLAAKDLEYHFAKPVVSFTSDPTPLASDAVKHASAAIVYRWRALRDTLSGGKVIVRGTFVATGTIGFIDPLQWTRAGLCVDVRNGDLFEEENNKLTLRWSGLALTTPMVGTARSPSGLEWLPATHPHQSLPPHMFHVEPPEPDGARPTTTEPQVAARKSSKAISRVETKEASRQACLAWLVQLMQANPRERTESRESLWTKAQERWPGSLSERSFLAARAEAIRITGATAWSAAGASRKSARQSPR
jgi:hypothetical protein